MFCASGDQLIKNIYEHDKDDSELKTVHKLYSASKFCVAMLLIQSITQKFFPPNTKGINICIFTAVADEILPYWICFHCLGGDCFLSSPSLFVLLGRTPKL